MSLLALRPTERAALESLAVSTRDAQQLRRVQALLWLDAGDAADEVADRLRVSRQVIYKWVTQFQQRQGEDMTVRLAPSPRSGRPPTAQGIIEPLIDAVIERDPRDLGYRSTVWTAPLLTQYLREAHALTVSRQSVSRAIGRLHLRWKRPRHRLHRRLATWRQAKGGSNGACEDAHGPSGSCWTRPLSRNPHRSITAMGGEANKSVCR
jgi:transposase